MIFVRVIIMKIMSVILLFLYSMAAMVGVGTYHCGCAQSQGWVVMAVRTACPGCTTSTENCCQHNAHHHDDESDGCQDDDCCSLKYHYLKVDQVSVTQSHDIQTKVLSLFFLPFISVDNSITGVRDLIDQNKNHPPPGLLKIPLIFLHGQLRL